MIKSYEKLKKKEKQKYKVPKSAQDIVHVDVIHKDGIFQVGNKYTKTYRFSDINYAIASKEEKEGLYEKYDIHPLIPAEDALDISVATNDNFAVVDAMIELRQKDIIEYELKMNQFRDRALEIDLARIAEDERVKCPRCGSTNITTGQRGFKLTTGFIGSNKTVNRCGNCGYSWKPWALISYNPI